MSPIDTSGIKSSVRVDTERQETRVRGGNTEQEATKSALSLDTVQLTDTATKLAELQAEVSAASGVDIERVEAIRQQIADGSYEVDPDKIADALMAMEQELL